MELTKRRLKEIIAEEMNHLAETGDLNMITESEKKAFAIILEKLTPTQLEDLGLKRAESRSDRSLHPSVFERRQALADFGDRCRPPDLQWSDQGDVGVALPWSDSQPPGGYPRTERPPAGGQPGSSVLLA